MRAKLEIAVARGGGAIEGKICDLDIFLTITLLKVAEDLGGAVLRYNSD